MPHPKREHELTIEVARLRKEADDAHTRERSLRTDLAAANARADAAEVSLRESEENSAEINTHWTETLEALAAARRECEGLRKAGDRLLVLWADFTSQEMYGEHLRAGLEKRDFDDWDEAHANLRVEMER